MTSQWWRHAACRTEPKSTFFQLTNNGGDRVSDGPWFDRARTICASCPVRAACLADALESECTPRIGVPCRPPTRRTRRRHPRTPPRLRMVPPDRARQRPLLLPGLPRRRPQPPPHQPGRRRMTAARCGTASGYKRHQRARERPCDACVAAKAAYDTRWRATTPAGRLNRLRARAQARALGELRRRHPAEYRDIYEPLVAQILTDEPVDTEDPS